MVESWLIIHFAKLITFVSLAIKDVLFLRIVVTFAIIIEVFYQLNYGNPQIAFWNCMFLMVNTVQVFKLIRERSPIKIPDEIEDIYRSKFSDMTQREFIYFWNLGAQKDVTDACLIKEGDYQKSLFLILSGDAEVSREGRIIATLHRGEFVGEISFITKEPASADVNVKSKLYYIEWDQNELRKLKVSNSSFSTKLNQILGEDLARKIKHNSILKTAESERNDI